MNNADPSSNIVTKSIFIWLNILGFSVEVEDENQYAKLAEHLKKFQKLFNDNNGLGYKTKIISDGIILHLSNPNYGDFVSILKDIGKKQFKFINENKLFIRGGISVGTKYETYEKDNDNGLFISNGLARAVNMEAKNIDWPIIGTGKKVINKINDLFNINDSEEYFGLKRCFNKKGEFVYFIDFIQEDQSQSFYQLIKNKIEEFKEPKDSKVKEKYIWLLKYYIQKFEGVELPKLLKGVIL